MCARAPKNWASRWKSTSALALWLCANTLTNWGSAERFKSSRMRKVKPGKNSLNLISEKVGAQHAAPLQRIRYLDSTERRAKSAMRVQHQRRAKQHAGDHESDHASSEPPGTNGHPEELSLSNPNIRDHVV